MIRVFDDVAAALGVSVLLLVSTLPSRADAQDPPTASEQERETARELYRLGNERYAARDYRGALDAFAGAHRIMRAPTTGLGVAKARLELNDLLRARDMLRFVADYPRTPDEAPSFEQARSEATALAERVDGMIPRLEFRITDGGGQPIAAEVKVDGLPVAAKGAIELDPGTHVVQVTADGYVAGAHSLDLTPSERRVLQVALAPLAVPPPPPAPPSLPEPPPPARDTASEGSSTGLALMVTGFSVAGLGLVAGAVTGALSLSAAAELEDLCDPNKNCPLAADSVRSRSLTTAHVSTASFIVAGVGAVVGVVGVVVHLQDEPTDTALWLRLSPLGLSLGGSL
ncbi:MAG: hypothetical protein R3B72_08320 [Polyangiaceae bacterium]